MVGLIWAIIVLLVGLYLLGLTTNLGWWINIVLAIAILGVIFNLFFVPFLRAGGYSLDDLIFGRRRVREREVEDVHEHEPTRVERLERVERHVDHEVPVERRRVRRVRTHEDDHVHQVESREVEDGGGYVDDEDIHHDVP